MVCRMLSPVITALRTASAATSRPGSTRWENSRLRVWITSVMARPYARFGATERGFYLSAIAWFAVFAVACVTASR